ncbi:aldose 1-epimerase [Metallosphaera hakonensis]|uniref:aldose 1-epimerase n=1 Tax=Metallosphaera hakonensis TaxID=79601 RepID=UPI0006D2B49F|nr:aldose 1-epimerase [Metallosphaera hakonensis]
MIKISSRDMEAIIEPKGAYLYSLKKEGKNIILEGKERQTRGGMAILVPFANRIKGGNYRWNGKEYSLPLNKEGNAIHGLVMDKVFSIENKRDDAVSLATDIEDKGYPVRLHVNVKYNIASGLTCEIEVKNEGDETAPLTVGTHPYFIVKGMWSILPNTGKKNV